MKSVIVNVPRTAEGEAILTLFGGKTLFDSVQGINKLLGGKVFINTPPKDWDTQIVCVPDMRVPQEHAERKNDSVWSSEYAGIDFPNIPDIHEEQQEFNLASANK